MTESQLKELEKRLDYCNKKAKRKAIDNKRTRDVIDKKIH